MEHKTLKRFVKDYSLPIQVVQEPYFSYFLDLYNDMRFRTKARFLLLKQIIERCGSEDAFLAQHHQIRDKIIETVGNTDAYNKFNSMSMDQFQVPNQGYSSKDIYKAENSGKYFVLIDLKKANFQALKYVNPEIVLGSKTYEDFIGKFTDLDYMKNSKYLRQVIFGNLNSKRQARVERYLIQKVLDLALEEQFFAGQDIRMIAHDEIVIETSNPRLFAPDRYIELTKYIKLKLDIDVDIEVFRFERIGNTGFYKKEMLNKPYFELMCVPVVYYAQVYKKAIGKELNDMDLCFYYEHQICKFLKPLDFDESDSDLEHEEGE